MAGVDLRSRTADLLDEVVGAEVEGFYSYRIAETVLRLGTMMLPADRAQNVLAAARSPGSLLTRFSRPAAQAEFPCRGRAMSVGAGRTRRP